MTGLAGAVFEGVVATGALIAASKAARAFAWASESGLWA
jgi:hypothetical protein